VNVYDKSRQGITRMVVSAEHFLDVKVKGKAVRVPAIKLDSQPLETTILTDAAGTH
jgi:hypothetical protein